MSAAGVRTKIVVAVNISMCLFILCLHFCPSSGSSEHTVHWCIPAASSTEGKNRTTPVPPSSGPSELECPLKRTGM